MYLTRKDTPFRFGPEQKQAFSTFKAQLARAPTLAYFDKHVPTQVIVDASPVGIGAVWVQNQKGAKVPVCYVSRSLTEYKYSQTEREALGLVLACEGTTSVPLWETV